LRGGSTPLRFIQIPTTNFVTNATARNKPKYTSAVTSGLIAVPQPRLRLSLSPGSSCSSFAELTSPRRFAATIRN